MELKDKKVIVRKPMSDLEEVEALLRNRPLLVEMMEINNTLAQLKDLRDQGKADVMDVLSVIHYQTRFDELMETYAKNMGFRNSDDRVAYMQAFNEEFDRTHNNDV